MKQSILALTALMLGGCASIRKDECGTSDWESVGHIDGTRGYGADRFNEHTETCGKIGITPDRELYEAGRKRGLEEFCTAKNGAHFGEHGGSYARECPLHLEPAFLRGYEIGQAIREINNDLQNQRAEMQSTQVTLRRQGEPRLSDSERSRLLQRMPKLIQKYQETGRNYLQLKRRAEDL